MEPRGLPCLLLLALLVDFALSAVIVARQRGRPRFSDGYDGGDGGGGGVGFSGAGSSSSSHGGGASSQAFSFSSGGGGGGGAGFSASQASSFSSQQGHHGGSVSSSQAASFAGGVGGGAYQPDVYDDTYTRRARRPQVRGFNRRTPFHQLYNQILTGYPGRTGYRLRF